ncbi:hypothetical protein DFH08DRAFT_966822 [Mycena albidolilacea]|uniref:Uncharacterized protein n=1 Tax=Mycena albidolilacea TaxID=1033008 RepID=A0AAD6ZNL8_9AGAR|nr:hypothetical protein DFH08DRAFT_966822 [Mycena albidolilacea]
MSYSHLTNTPDIRDRRQSCSFSTIVPIIVLGQLTYGTASGIISSPQDLRSRVQPHFEESRPLRPNAPTMWSRPPLAPEARDAALRPRKDSFSAAGSQYPGQKYPQLMDFREYDRQSGGSSMHSPTPARHRPSYQPAPTAIVEELLENYDPNDPLEHQPAPADFAANVPGTIYPYAGPRVPTAPPMPAVDKGKGRAMTPDPFAPQSTTISTGSFPPPPPGLSGSPGGGGGGSGSGGEIEARHLVVRLCLILSFPLEFLPAQVLRHRIQDLVAVEVVAVVVADHLVRLRLQVLQVLPVCKGLLALHFISRLRIILSLTSTFSKWHKL